MTQESWCVEQMLHALALSFKGPRTFGLIISGIIHERTEGIGFHPLGWERSEQRIQSFNHMQRWIEPIVIILRGYNGQHASMDGFHQGIRSSRDQGTRL